MRADVITVANLARNQCRQVGLLELRGTSGYLSSSVAERTSCGSLDSPWLISVLPGQTIKVRRRLIGLLGCNTMFDWLDAQPMIDSRGCLLRYSMKYEWSFIDSHQRQ